MLQAYHVILAEKDYTIYRSDWTSLWNIVDWTKVNGLFNGLLLWWNRQVAKNEKLQADRQLNTLVQAYMKIPFSVQTMTICTGTLAWAYWSRQNELSCQKINWIIPLGTSFITDLALLFEWHCFFSLHMFGHYCIHKKALQNMQNKNAKIEVQVCDNPISFERDHYLLSVFCTHEAWH